MDVLDQQPRESIQERFDPGITWQHMRFLFHQAVPTSQIQFHAFLILAKSDHAKFLIDETLAH